MIKRLSRDFLVLGLASGLCWHVLAKDTPATENGATSADSISLRPISPGPADGPIACLTAKMLENLNYIKQPFNDSVSSRFLDRYIESLDPQHLHFLQSDLSE